MAKALEQMTLAELDAREAEILGSQEPVTISGSELSPSGLDTREQELVDSLARDGVQVSPIQDFTPIEQPVFESDILKMSTSPELAGADPNDIIDHYTALKTNEDKLGVVDIVRNKKKRELLPFVGSVFKAFDLLSLMQDAQIVNNGKIAISTFDPTSISLIARKVTVRDATKREKRKSMERLEKFLSKLEERQRRGISIGGRIAEGAMELPAFMVEFLLTGPIFKSGSIAAKATATKLLGRYAERATGKLAIKIAQAGFGSIGRTAVNVPRLLAGTVENMTKGLTTTDDGAFVFADADNPFSALAKSFADLYIENFTEVLGKDLGEGAKFISGAIGKKFPMVQKFTQALADKWISNAPEGATRTLSGFVKASATRIGYDGILEEMGEEQLGRILRSATGLQSFSEMIPSMEDLLVEAGIFTIPGGISLASNKIFRTGVLDEKPIARSLEDISDTKFRDILDEPFSPEAEQQAKQITVETKSKAIDANAKEATVTEPAGPIKRAIVRNIARAEDAVGTWGKTGLKVQKDLREISFRTAVNTGNTTQNIKPWVAGLDKTEKVTVAQLMDGAIPRENQPNRLLQRADAIKKEMDKIQKEAKKVRLRKTKLSGKAFPQVLNKEGQEFLEEAERDGPKSSKVFAWAQNQVTDGKFKNVDSAIIALQKYREGLISGKTGYIEGTRTLEIGNEFRDWNLDQILSNTIESSWEKIEAARQWGIMKESKTDAGQILLPFKQVQVDIAKIRVDVGNNEANALNEYLKAQYGLSGADTAIVKVAKVARTAQFVGKLAFSPLTISRNILDRYAKGLSHGTVATNIRASIKYPPFLNHWMKSANNIESQMIRAGAVLGHGHLSEGFTGTEGIISLIAKPFASSERGNQTYIALVKKMQLESDIKRLMELDGRTGPVSKVFDRMATIVGQSQKQTRNRVLTSLTNEQLADTFAEGKVDDATMSEVLHRTVTDSTFPLTLASKRLWWNSRPILQTATQFKVWSADQTRFIYKDVLKYGIQTGDYSRLVRFMLGTWLMGEVYNISRDFLLNKDESVLSKIKGGSRDEIMLAIGKDLIDGGLVGVLADFTYGIGDWAAGPTVNSLTGIATAIDQARGTATLPEALGQFLLQDAPALRQAQGVLDSLDSIFDENNLTEDYSRWQNRSFDFRKSNGESATDIIGNRFMRSLRGTPQKKVSDRSLSLNMIARQVLVGDYDDATKHIKRVMEQTKIEDIKGSVASFRQSMRNNSPFGNIAKKDMPLFLGQFSPDEVKKGLKLQQQWLKGYDISLKNAFSELEAEGFNEELKKKAEKYIAEIRPEIEKGIAVIKEALAK